MLTIFSIPKPFRGHIEIIQRNAIQSWKLLQPECQIVLVGDDYGTKETAEEFGVCHAPNVAVNEFGTPRDGSVLKLAEAAAEHDLMCYVNGDVILMNDVTRTVEHVKKVKDYFAICGQRWNLTVNDPIDFDSPWEDELRAQLAKNGRLYVRTGVDYLVFPRGLFHEIPSFSVGRGAYDCWLLYTIRKKGVDLVDATKMIKPVHQDHDYAHHDSNYPAEAAHNRSLLAGRSQRFIIKDRTHVVTKEGVKRARDFWRCWRFIRTADAMYPSMPAPLMWSSIAINATIDFARNQLEFVMRLLRITPPHQRTTGR